MNVRRLAEVIAADGHDIDILTSSLGVDVPLPARVRVLRAGRLPFARHLPIGPSFTKLFHDVLIFVRAIRLLRRNPNARYDVIQGFEEGAWIAAALGRMFRIHCVYDMDSDMEEQAGSSPRWIFRRLAPLVGRIDRWALRAASAVLTVCESLTQRARQTAPEKPIFQIEDMPNVPARDDREAAHEALRTEWNLPPGALVVYTGNLEAYQGVDLLVQAACRVLDGRSDVVFLIVGGEPAQIRALQRIAAGTHRKDRIVFTGRQPEAEMSKYLCGADILVSPRSSGSNTPLKLYSYLMSGTPVIVTDRPVHTQVVTSNEAMLAPPSPEGMAATILSLLDDPERRVMLGAAGKRLVEAKYSEGSFVEKIRAFLESLETLTASRPQTA